MSSFSRQHCPTCDDETVHRFSVCLTCKTVRVTPSEQRYAAGKRIRKRMSVDRHFARDVYAAERAKVREIIGRRVGHYDVRGCADVRFGKGRERTKL